MFPVFSLVLDQDVKPEMALLYPELYKDLTKVRALKSCLSQGKKEQLLIPDEKSAKVGWFNVWLALLVQI